MEPKQRKPSWEVKRIHPSPSSLREGSEGEGGFAALHKK